jgi:hypothetical protein
MAMAAGKRTEKPDCYINVVILACPESFFCQKDSRLRRVAEVTRQAGMTEEA